MSAAEAGAGDVGNADGGAGRLTVPSAVFPRASIVDHRGSVVESIWPENHFTAKGVVAVAIGIAVVGLGAAFLLWKTRGCVSTPFISDLALRQPEERVFTGTLFTCVTLFTMITIFVVTQQYHELRKHGQPLVLWFVSVQCLSLSIVGVFLVGMFPYDESKVGFFMHFIGASLFFCFGVCFALTTLLLWRGIRYGGAGSLIFGWIYPIIGLIAAAVLMPLYMRNFPEWPCGPGESGDFCIRAAEREDVFYARCRGERGIHASKEGVVCAIMEWVCFGSILASVACTVIHGADRHRPMGGVESSPLLMGNERA